MKGKKKIGILALSFAFLGVLSACGSDNAEETPGSSEQQQQEEPQIVIEDDDRTELRNILVDTKNVTKTFYIGQEFNSDGIIVYRSLAVYDKDNKYKGIYNAPTNDYTVNIDEVDMSTVGTYKVTVTHRHTNKILSQSYNIDVKTSLFDTTAGLTYNAGLEVTFSDNKTIKSYLLKDTEPTGDNIGKYEHGFNINTLADGLKIKLHKYTSDGTKSTETETVDLNVTDANVTIDKSSVPTGLKYVGSYRINVTYSGEVNINGKTVDNTVKSFVIVNVEDPIKSIKVQSGNVTAEQSLSGFDPVEQNWVMRVTPTVSAAYNEPFSYDKYTISDINNFNVGNTQEVTVKLKEDESISCTKNIVITESTTLDIVDCHEMDFVASPEDAVYTDMVFKDKKYIHGPLPKAAGIYSKDTDYATGNATYEARSEDAMNKTDRYGLLRFPTRITVTGKSDAFKFEMPKAGKILVYFASNADEARELCMYPTDSNTGAMSLEPLQTVESSDVKQKVTMGIFEVPEAGTYYIASAQGSLYVHGFVVATAK